MLEKVALKNAFQRTSQRLNRPSGARVMTCSRRSLGRSVARSLDRSIALSVARSIARSLSRPVVRSLDRSLDRLDGVSPEKFHPRLMDTITCTKKKP